ncbi:MAG: hypothetical protein HRT72_01565 [Flavobacteriales bacterium]|nr:hypothetical protein [Flavobacteriales bacterium]
MIKIFQFLVSELLGNAILLLAGLVIFWSVKREYGAYRWNPKGFIISYALTFVGVVLLLFNLFVKK